MTESAANGLSGGGYVASGEDQLEQAPYEHDEASAARAAALVDAAYAEATRWWDVGDHLRARAAEAGLDPGAPLLRELILAVSYALRLEQGGTAGCGLRPHTEAGDFAWPPRIAGVPPGVITLWRDVAGLVEHPPFAVGGALLEFADARVVPPRDILRVGLTILSVLAELCRSDSASILRRAA